MTTYARGNVIKINSKYWMTKIDIFTTKPIQKGKKLARNHLPSLSFPRSSRVFSWNL